MFCVMLPQYVIKDTLAKDIFKISEATEFCDWKERIKSKTVASLITEFTYLVIWPLFSDGKSFQTIMKNDKITDSVFCAMDLLS